MTEPRIMDWTDEGRRIGTTLDAFHAVVVVGADPTATAQVALGIGRVQAVHRRVAIGDLLGEAEPLQSLVQGDDPHGLVDSFIYGVSLSKVAQQVPDAGELFVMPTGTEPVDYDELFANPRWRRLISGFREVGALLIIAAPAGAPRVHELVDATDGAVLVGDSVPAEVSVAQSLAWIRPRRGAVSSVARSLAEEQTEKEVPAEPVPPPAAVAGSSSRMRNGLLGLAAAAAIAAAAYWYSARPASAPSAVARTDSGVSRSAAAGAVAPDSATRARRDSVVRDSTARAATAAAFADTFPVLPAANPADSANASGYAVLLQRVNTKSGALMELRGRFDRLPAATYGVESPTRFLLLMSGAYRTRAGADSLLLLLRSRRVLAEGFGSVDSYPFAFLVDTAVAPALVPRRLARYAAQGLPVYALRQPDGSARLYYGAYASPEQAALAVPQVREAGMIATLVYRTGRVF